MDREVLLTIAEVGATFSGLTTLVALLGNRGVLTTRIVAMMLLSLLAVLFALVPNLPFIDLADPVHQRWLCGVLAAGWIVYAGNIGYSILTGRIGTRFSELPISNRINTFIVHPVAITVITAAAFGLLGEYAGTAYTGGLILMLVLSGVLFVQIALSLLEREAG